MNSHATIVLPVVALLAGANSLHAQVNGGSFPREVRQTLVDQSLYTSQGCLEPCMCLVYEPPYSGPLTGTFTMRFSHADAWTVYYDVSDVSLHTGTVLEPALHFTGVGTYEYGGDFALTQRLMLTLTVDAGGAEPMTFDSGYSIVTGQTQAAFPAMSLRLETPIVDCSKRWMDVVTTADITVPHCAADLAGPGGVPEPDSELDNNDFVVFIDFFFAGDARADMGMQGGAAGGDGVFDNNDFVVFVDRFFEGC